MESYSKNYGEECQSSESGWTMYIGSSIDHDNNEDDDNDSTVYTACHGSFRQKPVAEGDDVDTDDSMASDASSGPGQQTEESQGKYNTLSEKYKKTMQQKNRIGSCEKENEVNDENEVVNDKRGVVSTKQSRNSVWFRGRKK